MLERNEVSDVWSIDRDEIVEHVYVLRDGLLVREREHHEVRGWPKGEPEHYGPLLIDCFDHGGSCYGAFEDGKLVGATVLERRPIGARKDRLQLKFLHVSRAQRCAGIGRTLFETAAARARSLGARQLYISATPSQNTVDFYLRRGCRIADEVDPELFALEPEDIHLIGDIHEDAG